MDNIVRCVLLRSCAGETGDPPLTRGLSMVCACMDTVTRRYVLICHMSLASRAHLHIYHRFPAVPELFYFTERRVSSLNLYFPPPPRWIIENAKILAL